MAETTETLLSQKLERSNWNGRETTDNFAEEKELTVTITLAEYRNLIKDVSISNYKVEEANKDKYERNSENTKLKARVKELEDQVFEYRKAYGEMGKPFPPFEE